MDNWDRFTAGFFWAAGVTNGILMSVGAIFAAGKLLRALVGVL